MTKTDYELVSEPIPNMELADAVLDRIISDPDHWYQACWAKEEADCGTTYCFAGWACALSGLEAAWQGGQIKTANQLTDGRFIETAAKELLGMTYDEAYQMFIGSLDYPDGEERLLRVKVLVEELRYRAKAQAEAFDRIAAQLINTVETLPEVVKPGYLCPESQAIVKALLGDREQ